jgi:hypothetical protein
MRAFLFQFIFTKLATVDTDAKMYQKSE